ncbi:MAG: general secretion pathway protein GspB [Geoalkalibacter sp.]|jgi:general secretion pathway protein B|uniref:general secretion pathway protein GspB n=1 Tax=Geoalkalibacter sp. TaxID=3041440 RepID=UPI002A9ECCEF|nr:general secretion pathway protein GspB [Thermodesulfobacteriota bacterium]
MSFILDALRKSDKKRPEGKAPDLGTEHFVTPPRASRRGLLILGVIALVVMLNGAIWLWWASRPSVPPQSGRPAEREIAQTTEPVKPSSPAPVKPQPPAEKAPTPATAPLPVVEAPVAPVIPRQSVGRTLIVPDGEDSEPRPLESSVPASEAQAASAQEEAERAEQSVEAAFASTTTSAEKIGDEIPPAVKETEEKVTVMTLRDLPSSMRAGLPDFSFSLHYYTADPSQRMVRINGRMLREGQLLQDDLLMEEITPGGAIFSHRGLRFEVVRY